MNILQALLLGLLQGLTEFLPVSSSGHLVLGEALLGIPADDITFEVLLHLDTLLAVVAFFYREIRGMIAAPFMLAFRRRADADTNENLRYLLLIILGTVRAAICGLLFRDRVEAAFGSTRFVGAALVFTSIVLFLTSIAKTMRARPRFVDALVIGVAQAAAILPGVSRSGSTISAGMFMGVTKSAAFNFSFLLSLPAVAGAAILHLKPALHGISSGLLPQYLVGMGMAFISGYISLIILRRIVVAGKFAYFGVYTLLVGLLALIFLHG